MKKKMRGYIYIYIYIARKRFYCFLCWREAAGEREAIFSNLGSGG